jgi:hypothetical protein
MLLQIFVVFQGPQDAEERRLRKLHLGADLLEGERCLAVETV